jgi:hypothetical protein
VLRGENRLLAAAATRQRCDTALELSRADRDHCVELRRQLEVRPQRRHFRRDPQAFLQQLEEQSLQSALPT